VPNKKRLTVESYGVGRLRRTLCLSFRNADIPSYFVRFCRLILLEPLQLI